MAQTVRFASDSNAIVIHARELGLPNPKADPRLFALMVEQCDEILRNRINRSDIIERTRGEIIANLSDPALTAARVACMLGVSERAFHRRLSERGTSYQKLLDEIRIELSTRLLCETHDTLQQIAQRLGYSSPGAFSRSARRWYGVSPSEVRAASRDNRSS